MKITNHISYKEPSLRAHLFLKFEEEKYFSINERKKNTQT